MSLLQPSIWQTREVDKTMPAVPGWVARCVGALATRGINGRFRVASEPAYNAAGEEPNDVRVNADATTISASPR